MKKLSVEGKMTIDAVANLKPKLLAYMTAGGSLELNLNGVREMDGAGLQLLIAAAKEAERRNIALKLVGDNPLVQQLIALCQLDPLLRLAAAKEVLS